MRLAPCGQTSDPAFASPMSVEIEMSAERPDAETRRLPKGSRKDLDSSRRPLQRVVTHAHTHGGREREER